jgi:hypothetical protein
MTETPHSFLADFVILLLTTLPATTYTFWGLISEWQNPAERRLAMMRTLPIPASTLLRCRLMLLVISLAVNVPVFFGAIYLVADVQLGPGAYLAFIAVWVGYALLWGGLTMYLDVVRGSRYLFMSTFVSGTLLIGLIVFVSAILGFQVVYQVGQLSSDHGLLTGLSALVAGVVTFLLAGRLSQRKLQRREIAP